MSRVNDNSVENNKREIKLRSSFSGSSKACARWRRLYPVVFWRKFKGVEPFSKPWASVRDRWKKHSLSNFDSRLNYASGGPLLFGDSKVALWSASHFFHLSLTAAQGFENGSTPLNFLQKTIKTLFLQCYTEPSLAHKLSSSWLFTLFHLYVYSSMHCSTFIDICESGCGLSTKRNFNKMNILSLYLNSRISDELLVDYCINIFVQPCEKSSNNNI